MRKSKVNRLKNNPYSYGHFLGSGRMGKAEPSIGQISSLRKKEIEDYQKGKELDYDVKQSLLFLAWYRGDIKTEREAEKWLIKNVKNKSAFDKLRKPSNKNIRQVV